MVLQVGADARQVILDTLPDGWSPDGKRILDFGAGAGKVLRHLLDEAHARAELERPVRDDTALLAHGVLTPRLRAEARLAAVEELLLPCANALTSGSFAAAA